jgi:tricorn protease interacting factor F2/3
MKHNNLNPKNYKITLHLDTQKDTFMGQSVISLNSIEETGEIVLNIDELEVKKCQLVRENNHISCEYEGNQDEKEISIILPEKIKDDITLVLEYEGIFHSDLLGMYKSKYEHQGKEGYVISTQFEEVYARRVFPCIDHPSKKATFIIELIVDKNLKAISNTIIENEKSLENNKKLVIFKETPKMCTYLLYIGVGNFEIREKKGDHLVRLITTPGKTQYGDLALDIAEKSLTFCEEFTSQKYPLEKCDLIAVPDFPFGAMENWGAITFRENMLLVYPDKTSSIGIFNIASVVAHEISHFWFGNLVSPLDWKYIWLNESFASYFTYAIPQKYHPEWHSWEHFIVQYYDSSLDRDGLINTFPVELEGDEEVFITPAKVGILYNKGAAILRMMVDYLGNENFKKGVGKFMQKYEYSNANSQKYWGALEEGTGKPIKDFADSWIHQSGYPIVSVRQKDKTLLFKQNHFTYLPKEVEGDKKLWFLPIHLKTYKNNGETVEFNFTFEKSSYKLSLPDDTEAIKINVGHNGFFRVNYDYSLLAKLGNLIKNHKLSPIDRYGIENDLFALVKQGSVKIEYYLDYLNSYYLEEKDYLPLVSIFSHLLYLYTLKDSKKSQIKNIGEQIITGFFEKYGYEPTKNEEMRISILKNYLLWAGASVDNTEVNDFCMEKFEDLLNEKKISPDILSSVLKVGAMKHPKAKDYFLGKITSPETPQVEKAYIYQALGCFQEESQILKALDIMIKEVPAQSWLYTFRMIGSNKEALDLLWKWFKEHLDTLEKKSPFVLARTIAALIPLGGLANRKDVEVFLNDYANKNEFHKDTIKMALEKLKINLRFPHM